MLGTDFLQKVNRNPMSRFLEDGGIDDEEDRRPRRWTGDLGDGPCPARPALHSRVRPGDGCSNTAPSVIHLSSLSILPGS